MPVLFVKINVKRYLLWVCLAALPGWAAVIDVGRTLTGIEDRYNRPRTMQLLFEQVYTGQGRPPRTESGRLYLRKPRRMRWEYTVPAGKLFVSDGKHIYLYSPTANRVEKMLLKESGDQRVPLAFLMGRLDFNRDFQKFVSKPQGEDVYIAAYPKSSRSPYERVEFLVAPDYRIKKVVVIGQDQSVMEFEFTGEKLNPSLAGNTFEFETPAGAEFVEITGSDDGTN